MSNTKTLPAGGGTDGQQGDRADSCDVSNFTIDGKETQIWQLARWLAGGNDVDTGLLRIAWPDCPADGPASRDEVRDWLQTKPDLLAAVYKTDPAQPPMSRKTVESQGDIDSYPQLPRDVRLTPEQEEEATKAGRWLDEYVKFASQASPMTPRSFHVAAGLFAGALAIARRLCLRVSVGENTIYPNLYLLFVGHSTLPRKTTALRVLRGLLREAGMERFLLADRQTPEAFTLDLTIRIPPTWDTWTLEAQRRWLEERGIAAQRGWLLEEASHLLDSFNRDYSSGLLPLVLDLYDAGEDGPSRNTINRGYERIRRPYLSIFGVTTYAALADHVGNKLHWRNGLWARFALINGGGERRWQFWPKPMDYPPGLVEGLRHLAYQLLPLPEAQIVKLEEEGRDGEAIKQRKVEVSDLVPFSVEVDEAAWKAWERYSKALSYDFLHLAEEGKVDLPGDLFANYGRLPTMYIKVAMILAALDAKKRPVRIEPRHVYRAQIIVEEWRAGLHHVLDVVQQPQEREEDRLAKRVVRVLEDVGEWVSRRDLLRRLSNKRWSDIENVVRDLVEEGSIERRRSQRRGPASEEYRLAQQGQGDG